MPMNRDPRKHMAHERMFGVHLRQCSALSPMPVPRVYPSSGPVLPNQFCVHETGFLGSRLPQERADRASAGPPRALFIANQLAIASHLLPTLRMSEFKRHHQPMIVEDAQKLVKCFFAGRPPGSTWFASTP